MKRAGLVVLSQEFPHVGATEAEYVISKVFRRGQRRKLVRPDPSKLADAIGTLQSGYGEILTLNGMATYREFERIFRAMEKNAVALKKSLRDLVETWSADYFLNVNQPEGTDSDELEFEHRIAEGLDRIVGRAKHALAAMSTERGRSDSKYWLEHSEESASNWLWRCGYPEVFEEHFGAEYAIPETEDATSPGFRFAVAVQEIAGLPITSHSTLRAHLNGKRRGRRSALGRDATMTAVIVP